MKEIKAPFHKRVAYFMSEHITLIAVLVLLGVVLFTSCQKAKALEVDFPSNLEDIMTEDINAHCPNYLNDYLNVLRNTVYPNCNSVTRFETDTYIGYVFYNNTKFVGMYGDTYSDMIYFIREFSYEFMSFSTSTVTNNGAYSLGISKNTLNTNTSFIYVYLNGGWGATNSLLNKTYSNLANTYSETVSLNYKQGTGGRLYTNYLAGYNSGNVVSGSTIISFVGNNKYYIWNPNSNNGLVNDDWDTVYPSAVEDSRLQFSKWTNALGKDMLHVELTDFVSDYLNLTTNVEVPQFDFTVEYTEAISGDTVDLTYNFDDSSEYFDAYYENAKLKRVYFNIPFSELVGYNLQSNSFPDYSDVRITSAVLDLDYVVIGGGITGNVSESILTNFYLQHVYSEVVPDVIPDPSDVYEDVLTQVQIDGSKLIVEDGGSGYTAGNFQFVTEYPTFFSWAVVNTKHVFYETGNTGVFYEYPSTIMFKYYDSNYIFDIAQYIYDNAESMYFDVIVISVKSAHWNTGNVNPDDPPDSEQLMGYYVFYTNRFYARLDAINQLNLIDIFQKEANQDKENWTWLVTKLNDFEAKTLVAITGEENSLFTYINDLDNDLNSGISRIIESLPDFEPFDESAIIDSIDSLIASINSSESPSVFSKLDSIIGLLTQSNVNSDWYANYKEWLYTRNEDAIVDPHEFFVSELDDVKSMFSSFFHGAFIAEFTSDMGTLLDYLKGDSDYLDMYIRTGIQDESFDIDTYTIYRPGGV